VSYNKKHNDNNGEQNRDGTNNNNSYNYGTEGPSLDPGINKIREQQMKNFIATLMVSIGTPMILGGDEIARTQNGNNNAYCQDNEISWYNWSLLENNKGLYRFFREMIAFRRRHPGLMRPEFYTGREGSYNAIPDISWYNEKGENPKWESDGYCLALRMDGSRAEILADQDDNDFFIMFNSSLESVNFIIAEAPGKKKWYRAVDTSYKSPNDILAQGKEETLASSLKYRVKSRSMVILISKDVSNE
jgi:glycogen operon protein